MIQSSALSAAALQAEKFLLALQRRSAGNGFTFVSFRHKVEEVFTLITCRHANPNLPTRSNTASTPFLDF
jgi:hypothetical protein